MANEKRKPIDIQRRQGPRAQFIREVILCHSDERDCLIWPFARDRGGRANWANGPSVCRLICELTYGPAPSVIHQAAHSCGRGDRGCVNPTHLRWATPAENAADTRRHNRSGKPPVRLSEVPNAL